MVRFEVLIIKYIKSIGVWRWTKINSNFFSN